jgi:O-antigen ligase
VRRRRLPPALLTLPALLAALLLLFILLSTVFSRDPKLSARHLGGVLLLLALPIAIDLVETARQARAIVFALAGSSCAIALVGIWQYLHGGNDLSHRIAANLSIYMTFAGLEMVAACLLLGYAFEESGRRRWIGAAAVLPLAAMVLTFTRNAYVGLLAALVAYLALRRPRGLLLLAPAAVLLFFLLPAPVRARVRSIADVRDPSNRDRIAMLRAGGRMIADAPVFGLGPEMVKRYYPLYREPDAEHWRVPHLHDNAVQLAAASGVPAAAAYLALAFAVLARTGRRLRRETRPGTAAILAGVWLASVALFVAGLFEYNFGDTEIEMATLLLWGLPFAAATASPKDAAGVPAR